MEKIRQFGMQDPVIEIDPDLYPTTRLGEYLRLRNGLVEAKLAQEAIGDDTAPEWVQADEAAATLRDEARALGFSVNILGQAVNHRIKQLKEREAKQNGRT